MATELGAMVAATTCLMLYSMLYGDNPVSRTAEALYMGFLAAYNIIIQFTYFYVNGIVQMTEPGKIVYAIPVILGILIYTRLYAPIRWLYKFPMAVMMGSMLGVAMRTTVFSQIIAQIVGDLPPIAPLVGVDAFTLVNNLLIIIGSVTGLLFFVFSQEFIGPTKYIHRTGRLFMLAAFGATYGNTGSYRYELMAGCFTQRLLDPGILWFTEIAFVVIAVFLIIAFKMKWAQWT